MQSSNNKTPANKNARATKPTNKNAFTLTPLRTIINRPYKPRWLIKDYMELNSIGMLFGAPASGKSLLAMDIAYCIATGIDWNGNQTKKGKVVYLAGEGFNGQSRRFQALEQKYKLPADDIVLSEMPASLIDQDSVDIVYNEIRKMCPDPALIIIDTLHRNFGTGDENSAKDFGCFLNNITLLMRAVGSSILLVHHSGHSSSERSRGSSSIKGSLDVEYKISNNNGLVTMVCKKAKEFSKPVPVGFNIVSQSLPNCLDENGIPEAAAILISASVTPPSTKAVLSAKEAIVLRTLNDAIQLKGVSIPNAVLAKHPKLNGGKFVHKDLWRQVACKALDLACGGMNKQDSNKATFKRAITKLKMAKKINEYNGYYWEEI